MKYEKIQTLWKRDKDNKFCIMRGEHSKKEFSQVKEWVVTEKVDGMNIRVIYNKEGIRFAGRTDKAHLPDQLAEYLRETFTMDKMQKVFDLERADTVILYGEGYGAKIQKGGNYRQDQAFILFDVYMDGIWLEIHDMGVKAYELGVDSIPIFGRGTITTIEQLVERKPQSEIDGADCIIEGVVCKSDPLLLDRFGNRVIWKLKVRDYEQLERLKK